METTSDQLKAVKAQLGEILGDDLADSLVRAGQTQGDFALDLQLLVNDGLQSVPPEKRQQVLSLLDRLTS